MAMFAKDAIKRPGSLQVKIFIGMIILLTIAIVITSFIWYTNASGSLERNAGEYLSSSVETINSRLDSYLKMINSTANNIAYGYPQYRYVITNGPYSNLGVYMGQVRDIENNILKNIFAFSYDINGVAIVSKSGYMFKTGYLVTTTDALNSSYIQKAMSGKYKVVYIRQNRTFYPTVDSETLTMAVPIRFQNEVAGVVMMDLGYKRVLDIYYLQLKELSSTKTGIRIVSFLPDGQILYDSNEQIKNTVHSDLDIDDIKSFIPTGKSAVYSGNVQIKGREYVSVSMTAEYSGIATVGIIPVSDLRSQINSGFTWTLGGTVIVLLLVMAATFLVTKQTTKKLLKLQKTMQRIGKQGVGIRADIKGTDEIAQLAGTFNSMMQRVEELMNKITQEEKALHQMELDVFRSQINPHFLYNTLITIRHLAKLRGARNIDEVALSLSKILRAVLDKDSDSSTVAEDLELLGNYMNIQRFRYTENISLISRIDQGLENAVLPKMILQPLVENALIHGYGGDKTEGRIEIGAERVGQDMLLHVKDEGEGIEEEQIRELLSLSQSDGVEPDGRVHVGIKNVHRRLQLLYGTEYGLSIDSRYGSYTVVTVKIPLQFK